MKELINITEEQKINAEKQILEKIKNYDYDTVEYPIEVIIQQYEDGLENDEGEIYIPDYQREFVWSEKRKCKFIESIILGIPIPYIFFADVDGRYEIVDGSQRIRTLHAFISDKIEKEKKLKLENLEKLTELNGFYFEDLSVIRQRRIRKKSLKMIALGEKTDAKARIDLFERINTGSDELKQIEVLKGTHGGKFYDFISECAENELFRRLCPISEKRTLREEPQQMVLRFFAYSENRMKYKGNVAPFIEKYLKSKQDNFTDEMKEKMLNAFLLMLNFVDRNFKNGFAKTKGANSTPRVRFEAISVGVHLALLEKPTLDKVKTDWLESDEFKTHTRSDAANNKLKLIGRTDYVKNKILEN
ncbi:MAG: Unknown protein [uncultured Sulfurovum sp.]|uniref:GmrSD restriction endonucleases N-terminal domain-containing protein n=1 Tax=uncultured Sulfurovum sp. TaxID=269237 RepID=A0A6S6TY29_9BACT|nr:MAG: Unknown protein [uncultured Sulfurovum sp.]